MAANKPLFSTKARHAATNGNFGSSHSKRPLVNRLSRHLIRLSNKVEAQKVKRDVCDGLGEALPNNVTSTGNPRPMSNVLNLTSKICNQL
jgi:hypothetical protein